MSTVITLPPSPKPGKTLAEFTQAVTVWTRQAEQTIRTIAKAADSAASSTKIASSAQTGLLSASDWSLFHGKQPTGAYLTDAPVDGATYGRKNGSWVALP